MARLVAFVQGIHTRTLKHTNIKDCLLVLICTTGVHIYAPSGRWCVYIADTLDLGYHMHNGTCILQSKLLSIRSNLRCTCVRLYVLQAADFAFGQFRFLVRLLLLHGRQSYLRCREVVLYAFYKNVAYVSCYIFFSFYSGERCKLIVLWFIFQHWCVFQY